MVKFVWLKSSAALKSKRRLVTAPVTATGGWLLGWVNKVPSMKGPETRRSALGPLPLFRPPSPPRLYFELQWHKALRCPAIEEGASRGSREGAKGEGFLSARPLVPSPIKGGPEVCCGAPPLVTSPISQDFPPQVRHSRDK